MTANLVHGLKWQLYKTAGVDNIILINDSDQPVSISYIELRLNICIGKNIGEEQKSLIKDAAAQARERDKSLKDKRDDQISEGTMREMKELVFEMAMDDYEVEDTRQSPQAQDRLKRLHATDLYLCPWGELTAGAGAPGRYTRTDLDTCSVFEIRYLKPLVIAPHLQATFSYASSFKYLVYACTIGELSALPKVSVAFEGNSQAFEIPVHQVTAAIGSGKRTRQVDITTHSGIVGGAALPRRVLGYYANYFGYQRDVFVQDLPFGHLNEISYGMFSIDLDGRPVSSDKWGDDWQMSSLQLLKRFNPDLKVNLIVGGWPKELPFDIRRAASITAIDAMKPTSDKVEFSFYVVDRTLENRTFTACFLRRWGKPQPDGSRGPGGTGAQVIATIATMATIATLAMFTTPAGRSDFSHGDALLALLSRTVLPASGDYQDMELAAQLQIQFWLAEMLGTTIQPAADLFAMVSRDESKRERFARDIVDSVRQLGFDGVELDWEYPTAEDGPHYVALLEALRRQVTLAAKEGAGGRPIAIAIAAPASPARIRALDSYWRPIGELVDHIHVMTYDYGGQWLDYADFNAPMRAASDDPGNGKEKPGGVVETIETMLEYTRRLCFSRRQLSLGLPVYGRGVEVSHDAHGNSEDWALGVNRPVLGPTRGQFADQPGTYLYSHIVREMRKGAASTSFPAFTASPGLHAKARAPSLLVGGAKSDAFITYDNPASIREKIRYARLQALGGVMAWDLSGDLPVSDPQSILRAIGEEIRHDRPARGAAIRCTAHGLPLSRAAAAGTALPAQRLWSAARDYGTLREVRTLAQSGQMRTLAPLPGGRCAVSQDNGLLQVMELAGDTAERPWRATTARWLGATALALLALPSGPILAMLDNGNLLRIDPAQDGAGGVDVVASGLGAYENVDLLPGWGDTALLRLGNRLHHYDASRPAPSLRPLSLIGPDGSETAVMSAVALPGGLLATGGERRVIATIGIWSVENGAARYLGAPPRAVNEDSGDIAFLSVLSDGAVAALTAYGNYQVYTPDALNPGTLQSAAWCLLAQGQLRGRALLALPQGGFLSVTDGFYLFWTRREEGDYALVHRLPQDGFIDAIVLDDGDILVARADATLQHIEPRAWPRSDGVLSATWDWREGEDQRSWLHELVAAGNLPGLRAALAAGAPADQVTAAGASPASLLGLALDKGRAELVPVLLAAGAPLWSAGEAARASGAAFTEPLLAALLPAPLRSALPHFVPDLPADAQAIVPPEIADFLSDNPLLATQFINTLAPFMPAMARAVQRVVQDFAVDEELLAAAAGEGKSGLMHLVVDAQDASAAATAAEGVGKDLLAALASLKGRRFDDQQALQGAIDAAWPAPDKLRPWRVAELDQVLAIAVRPRHLASTASERTVAPAVREAALRHYGTLVELGWPVEIEGKPVRLAEAAPLFHSLLMQAGAEALTPAGHADPVLRETLSNGDAGWRLPVAVQDFLWAAPFMAEPFCKAANSIVDGLDRQVRQFLERERQAGGQLASDLAASQDPFGALADLDDGAELAGRAMYALVREGTRSSSGGQPSHQAILALMMRRGATAWIAPGSVDDFPQGWFAWAEDPLHLPADPRTLPAQSAQPAASLPDPAAGKGIAPAAATTDDHVDPDASAYRQIMQGLRAGQMKQQLKAWQTEVKFDLNAHEQEEVLRARSVHQDTIRRLNEDILAADVKISGANARLARLDELSNAYLLKEPPSPAQLRQQGFTVTTPKGGGDNDPLTQRQFDDLIIKEEERIAPELKTQEDERNKLVDKARSLKYSQKITLEQHQLEKARLKATIKEADLKISKMQDYAMLAEQANYYGGKLIDKYISSAKVAEVLKTILVITTKVIRAVTAIASAFYGLRKSNAMMKSGAIGKGGMALDVVSIVFNVAGVIMDLINGPQPDPTEEMLKAISKQLDELARCVRDVSEQVSSLTVDIDQRLDRLDARLDDMTREMNRQFANLGRLLEEGFTLSRSETRQSTAQILLALQRGFDAVERRFDMLQGQLRGDLAYLQSMMTSSLMNDYEVIDIAIGKEETEPLWSGAGHPLSDDPARLMDLRNRLINGVRNKLLGLAPQPLEQSLDGAWLRAWPTEVGVQSDRTAPVLLDRLGSCHDFFGRRMAGAVAPEARIYFSAPYGLQIAERLLWVSERLLRYSCNPVAMVADVDELLIGPLERMLAFLSGTGGSEEFFNGLFADHAGALRALAERCALVHPGDVVQGWRIPASRMADQDLLMNVLFDAVPVLSLDDIGAETVPAEGTQQRERRLSDFNRLLTSPALSWRARKLLRTLTLAHILGVATLSLDETDKEATLWVTFQGGAAPVAQLSLVADVVADSRLLMTGNSLAVRISHDCRAVQRRAVAIYHARVKAEAGPELQELDASLARLIQFMALAGLSEAGMAQTLSRLWQSGRVAAYLEAQDAAAALPADGGAAPPLVNPPLSSALRIGLTQVELARNALRATMAALPGWPEDDARRDPLPAHLLARAADLLARARAHRAALVKAGEPVPMLIAVA